MKRFRRVVIVVLLLIDVAIVALFWGTSVGSSTRVTDQAGIIPVAVVQRYNQYLDWVQQESGIDVRILLVPETRGETLERFAVRSMRTLGVGKETGGRGLLVYDTLARTMRIEVGPKLQGIFPDAFIGYLMREHVGAFFDGGDRELGLRSTLFMMHWRIRMARLGEAGWEEIMDLARFGEEHGVEFLAFHTWWHPHAPDTLATVLAAAGAPFPPWQVYRWRPGLLGTTMAELDIRVGQPWQIPLVAVLDRDGAVVWQGQAVSDWSLVRRMVESALTPRPVVGRTDGSTREAVVQ